MNIAALYDIHGNLPALEAVLDEVRALGVDRLLIGGDVVPGPMPRETLAYLSALEIPADYISGNGEREDGRRGVAAGRTDDHGLAVEASLDQGLELRPMQLRQAE